MIVYAIIPSRSGSKRFKNKNISILNKKYLFSYTINFAKKLKFVKKIIFTSDSQDYLDKASKFENVLLHKRSIFASRDNSMEEHILKDLKKFFLNNKIKIPDAILWLRPTHPLRCLNSFNKVYRIFKKNNKTSVLVVHKQDSRLFKVKGKYLYPVNNNLKNRSMIRGQDCEPFYSIFSGELFKFPKKINKNFLGNKKLFLETTKYTNFDIDNYYDLKILENLINSNKKVYKKYLHD